MTLGERLLVLRHRRGWSQRELGKASSICQALISDIESGKRDPADVSLGTLQRLAAALEVSLDTLIHDDETGFDSWPAGVERVEANATPADAPLMVQERRAEGMQRGIGRYTCSPPKNSASRNKKPLPASALRSFSSGAVSMHSKPPLSADD